jgi:hypothetical protein
MGSDMPGSRPVFKIVRYGVMVFFIGAQFYLIFVKRHDTMILDVYPNAVPSPRIFADHTVGQTFVAKSDGLARIDVMVGTYMKTLRNDIYFELWQIRPGRRLVRQAEIRGSEVQDNLYAAAKFEPLPASRGSEYEFEVSLPAAAAEDSISLWMTGRNLYREGTLLVDGVPARGDLAFRAYARRSLASELGRIVNKYPRMLSSPFAFACLVVIFEAIQVAFLWWLMNYLFGGFAAAPRPKVESGKTDA